MDPHTFNIGLMAGIALYGGAILTAMTVLEQPRCRPRACARRLNLSRQRLRHWLEQKWPRQKIHRKGLQVEGDHARRPEQVLQDLEHRRTRAPAKAQGADRADSNGGSKGM